MAAEHPTEHDHPPAAAPASIAGGQLAVLDASPNAIVGVDETGDVIYANAQASIVFGVPHDELVGETVDRLLPERLAAGHPARRAAFLREHVARPMGLGLELSGRRHDGTEFPVEISLAPVSTSGGLVVFATIVDITDRKAAETALAESDRRFRSVVEAGPNPVIGVSPDGVVTYANPSVLETFGWRPEELVGGPIERIIPDRFADRHVGHRTAYVAAPHARPMGIGLDLWALRRDGSEFPVEISLSPVGEGERMQVFARVVDISARKALENQLLQAQKMESIGRLAGGIAHDFNNMLSAMRGYAELLLDDLAEGEVSREETRASVAAIYDAADRAAALTAQLLAFSRRTLVTPQTIDLSAAVRGLEPMLRRLIGEQVELVISLDDDAGTYRGDPGQLDQILVNLVVNARDAVPEGGRVIIETAPASFDESYALEHFEVEPGRYAMLSVADTGVGMDQETRRHIFEPFFTTKERGQGTGLGLATIYGIVRQTGGHIWLYSEPGQGTTFKVYFPLSESEGAEEEAAATAPEPVARGRVLVVEDEPMVRDFTTRVLARQGYEVTAAADAQEAIRHLDATEFEAIVSDVVMPGLSGPELVTIATQRVPGIRAVLLSGYTAETLKLDAVLQQGAEFVSKPFTARQLTDALARALQPPSG